MSMFPKQDATVPSPVKFFFRKFLFNLWWLFFKRNSFIKIHKTRSIYKRNPLINEFEKSQKGRFPLRQLSATNERTNEQTNIPLFFILFPKTKPLVPRGNYPGINAKCLYSLTCLGLFWPPFLPGGQGFSLHLNYLGHSYFFIFQIPLSKSSVSWLKTPKKQDYLR